MNGTIWAYIKLYGNVNVLMLYNYTFFKLLASHATNLVAGTGAAFGNSGDCPTGWHCLPDSDANTGTCFKV